MRAVQVPIGCWRPETHRLLGEQRGEQRGEKSGYTGHIGAHWGTEKRLGQPVKMAHFEHESGFQGTSGHIQRQAGYPPLNALRNRVSAVRIRPGHDDIFMTASLCRATLKRK